MKKSYVLVSLLSLFSIHVLANQDTNKHVGRLGVHGGNAYFSVKEGLSTACKFDIIYTAINTDSGKAAYSALLLAKSSKTVLRRINYDFNASTELCTLTLVELEEQ